MVKKNNTYLKDIADTVGGDADGVHTDNYYLKQISENITGGGGGEEITVDSELSTTSENPVQNKIISNALNDKVDESSLSTVAKTGDYDDLSNKPVLDFVKVTTDKGTASASTMNKLYIEVGANKTDAYYTVENNGVYSWKKFDEDILDDLSIEWNDIANKPNLFSGNYNDLSNKPTLFSGDYDDLIDKPTIPSKISDLTDDSDFVESSELSTVATSGDYDDLTDKPTIPSDVEDLNPSTATFTITYTDDSTEDVEVVIVPNNSGGE